MLVTSPTPVKFSVSVSPLNDPDDSARMSAPANGDAASCVASSENGRQMVFQASSL